MNNKATYKDYGNVTVLNYSATNRGGLVLIEVSLPKAKVRIFKKRTKRFHTITLKKSTNTFWVRAGDVLPG